MGMAAAVLVTVRLAPGGRGPLTLRGTWVLRAGGTGAALLAMVVLEDRGQGSRDWLFHTACALAFGALVVAGALGPARGAWHRASSRGVLPLLGLVSYSLYLWHEPLQLHLAGNGLLPAPGPAGFLPTVLVVGVLGVLVAWLSYWTVEHPASHLRHLFGPVRDRRLDAGSGR